MFGLNKGMSAIKMHRNKRHELPSTSNVVTNNYQTNLPKQGVGRERKTTSNLKPNDQFNSQREEDNNLKG